MEEINNRSDLKKFKICTGKKEGRFLKYEKQCGEAIEVADVKKPHYVVSLWIFPEQTFYLCKSKDRAGHYTLFAKRVEKSEGEFVYRNPIGFAMVSETLRSHLEIQMTLPRQRVFMSLFPENVVRNDFLYEKRKEAV